MSALTTDEMREDYIWRNRPRPSEETAAEFDAWLNGVRAEAWSEGEYSAIDRLPDSSPWPEAWDEEVNPYRRADR